MNEAPMVYRRVVLVFLLLLLVIALCGIASGQSGTAASALAFNRIPSMFQQQLNSLGNRVKAKGKEKTVYEGELFDSAGNSKRVRVIHQLPGLVRLEGFKKDNTQVLSFDGERGNGIAASKEDESLIEVFIMDLAEGMLASVQQSAAVRMLGFGFGPDPVANPNYSGPRYDVYEITGPVQCRKDKLIRSRLYYFDSQTGLLQSTRYYDRSVTPPVKIETRFSMWGKIDGSAYPARIDHYKGGKLAFSFIAETIAAEASIDKANF
jgi:hypothetical protein